MAKKPQVSEIENLKVVRKSIVAKQDIQKGEILTEDNIVTKRVGEGLSAFLWDEVIGKEALYDFKKDEKIRF